MSKWVGQNEKYSWYYVKQSQRRWTVYNIVYESA